MADEATREVSSAIKAGTHLLECAVETRLLHHREHVDGTLRGTERLYGGVYLLVARLIETAGMQYVAHHSVGILLEHYRTEHGFLKILVLRLYTANVSIFDCC